MQRWAGRTRLGFRYRIAKRRTHQILSVGGGRASDLFDVFIMSLIALNVLAVMLSTVDPIYDRYQGGFYAFEAVSVAIFSLEYVGRVWSCTEIEGYDRPVVDRLRFAARPMVLIDLLAIAPFFLGAFLPDLRFLRVLRLLRFFRLLKLARYSDSMQSFATVFRHKQADLTIALSATTILLVLSSSLMYYAERGAQPETFSSIPASMWWGVVTLTTVGYGDTYPLTATGRLLGAVIALLGVGLVALPASILAQGFIEEAGTEVRTCPHCDEEIDKFDA